MSAPAIAVGWLKLSAPSALRVTDVPVTVADPATPKSVVTTTGPFRAVITALPLMAVVPNVTPEEPISAALPAVNRVPMIVPPFVVIVALPAAASLSN